MSLSYSQIYPQCQSTHTNMHAVKKKLVGVRVVLGGKWLLNENNCFSELTSNFPFFSSGSTWASLDIAASLFGTPSPSISSTIITVSHFPKLLAGNMSDLMLSPKYTTCSVRETGWKVGLFSTVNCNTVVEMQWWRSTAGWTRTNTTSLQKSSQPLRPSHLFCPPCLERKASWDRLYWDTFQT